jgi:O-antigen/teichoic acid export membrane protein
MSRFDLKNLRSKSANTLWGMAAEAGRVLTSGVCFFLLARTLGPRQFGQFAGLLALVSVFFPFAALGAGNLLVMRVARDPSTFRTQWYIALRTVVVGSTAACVAAVFLARLIMPSIPLSIVIAVSVAELIACSAIEVSGHTYVAHDRLRGVAILRTLLGGTRVVGLMFMMVSGTSKTLAAWAPLYLLSTILAAAIALIAATRAFGRPEQTPMRVRELGRGLPFAFGAASAEVQDDIDKTLLVRFGFLAEAGVYAVAYRVVSFVFLPVRALLFASYASFFRVGADGAVSARRLARRLMVIPLIYTSAMAAIGMAGAGVFQSMLGDGYESAAVILRLLLFLPIVRVLQYFPADALTGSGHQHVRAGLQTCTAVLNVALNVALIPRLGWRGPVVATFASEVLFAAVLWWRLNTISRRETRSMEVVPPFAPSTGLAA